MLDFGAIVEIHSKDHQINGLRPFSSCPLMGCPFCKLELCVFPRRCWLLVNAGAKYFAGAVSRWYNADDRISKTEAMRVAVGSLLQETNTFSPQATRRHHFQLATGPALTEAARREETEVRGFLDVLEAEGIEAVPLLGGWAVSYGRMVEDEFRSLVEDLLQTLRDAGPLDAVLLALHGAWAAEGADSADGYVLERVRGLVGPSLPVVVSLDLHSNLARAIWTNADVLVGYQTSPHVDTCDAGRRAAAVLVSMLKAGLRPTMAVSKLPLVTQAEEMMSDRGVFKQLLTYTALLEDRPGVVSASMFACQPWLDVEELGWSSVVITDDDPSLAQELADELASEMWSHRHQFVVQLPGVDEALDQAMRIEGGPVTLGEGADGTMGGSPGDSTFILEAILERGLDVPTAAVVVDPDAVGQAIAAGVGQMVNLSVGGKLNPGYARPLAVKGRVKLISDGEFRYKGRVYTGRRVRMGRAVVLKLNQVNLLIGERTMPTTDPELYRSHGIEPRDMKLVLVKSPLGFRTDYEPISKAVISVDTPGCCRADLSQLPFERIPRPIFPLDPVEDWRRPGS